MKRVSLRLDDDTYQEIASRAKAKKINLATCLKQLICNQLWRIDVGLETENKINDFWAKYRLMGSPSGVGC